MKPKKSPHKDRQSDLFRVELCRIVDPSHGLIKLANVVEWDRLDDLFGSTYCPQDWSARCQYALDGRASLPEVRIEPQRRRGR